MPAKNEAENLPCVLSAVREAINNYGGNAEIILVDNGSDDSTIEIAKKNGCRVLGDGTATISRLRNMGVREAQGDIIAFLDADCVVDRNWLTYCLEKFSDARIGVVGTRAIPDLRNPSWVEEGWFRLISGAARPDYPNWLGTSNLLVRKSVFSEAGGFDEKLETAEDVDFCRRINNRYLICLEKRIDTVHLRESKTIIDLYKREKWRGKCSLFQLVNSKEWKKEILSILAPGIFLLSLSMFIILFFINIIIAVIFVILLALMPIAMIVRKKALIDSKQSYIKIYLVALVYLFARSIALFHEVFVSSLVKTYSLAVGKTIK